MSENPSQNSLLPDLFTDSRWIELGFRLRLSRREAQTARLICRGAPGPRIADELGVSRETARMHVRRLYKKLDVHDRAGVPVRLVLTDRELQPAAAAEQAAPIHPNGGIQASDRLVAECPDCESRPSLKG